MGEINFVYDVIISYNRCIAISTLAYNNEREVQVTLTNNRKAEIEFLKEYI